MSQHRKRQRAMTFKRAAEGKDRPRCTYCGAAMSRKVGPPGSAPQMLGGELTFPFSQDHVVPRARGGTDAAKNRVACCGPCNGMKGQDDLVVFIARLGERAIITLEEAKRMQADARAACEGRSGHV